MKLSELTDAQLDYILGMGTVKRAEYLSTVLHQQFPNVQVGSKEYTELLECYISSFFVEKLYRSNRFFNEKFIVTYTDTGMIHSITSNIYFDEKSFTIH